MEFFIKKNATLPVLKLQVVKDGRSDYDNFMKTIELSAIFFSMVDVETGIPKISTRPAGFVEKVFEDPNARPEYYIYYQFTNKDTNRVGRYEAQFMLRNEDGVLILPIRESFFINVQESFVSDELPYESCYTSEFPCCVSGPVHPTTTTTTTTNITTTTTTTSPVTPTPTPTPTPTETLSVTLLTVISSGSVIVDYYIILPKELETEYNCNICKSLNVDSGEPIIVEGSISIPSGQISGTTQIIIDENWNRIAEGSQIISFVQSAETSEFTYDYINTIETYTFTPKPNPNVTPTPTPTITTTYTPSSTPTLTMTPILTGDTIYYGKLEKLIINSNDVTLLDNLITLNIGNTYLEYEMSPGFCYLVVPETMSQPTIFKNSVDGCNGFTIPFARLDNITIVDINDDSIIYYVYRSFVSTSSNVDVWVCD